MKLDNFVASSDIYDVYESDGMAVRIYKKPEYKEKCLYAALTHARVETTLGNSFIKMPVLHEVSVIDGKWAITMDFIKGKTLQQLMDENPDKKDTYLNQFIDIQCEIHAQYMPLLSKLKDKMARQIKTLGQIDEIKKYELLQDLIQCQSTLSFAMVTLSQRTLSSMTRVLMLSIGVLLDKAMLLLTLQEHTCCSALTILILLRLILISIA